MLVDDVADAVLEAAGELELLIYVGTGTPAYSLPLQLTEVARRCPNLRFLMGHMGHTDFWIDSIPAALATPNIFAEISYKQPHVIIAAVAALGPERVVYGSDAPFNAMRLELEKLMAAELDERQLELVAGEKLLSLLPAGVLS